MPIFRPVSSTRNDALGSPSRGWPTDPGLRSQASAGARSMFDPFGARPPSVPSPVSQNASAKWLCPTRTRSLSTWRRHWSATSIESTYSHTGSRGLAWKSADVRARARRLELPEERARVVLEHLPGPARAHARVVREDVDVDLPEDGEVVVADEADVGALGDEAAALVRTRPVPYEVTQAPDLVRRLGIDRFEHRLEGMQVPVNVADDAGAHTRRRTLTKAAVGIGLAAVWIGVAAWLWRTEVPGDLDLPSLDPGAFFSAEHLSRAERWGRGSRILYFVRLAVELAVVALFVWKGKALAAWLQRWTKGRVRTGRGGLLDRRALGLGRLARRSARSGTGASASTGSRTRATTAGSSTRRARSGSSSSSTGSRSPARCGSRRRFGRRWWLVASPILVALSVVFILVQPLILQPLCERLPAAAGQASRRRGAAARRGDGRRRRDGRGLGREPAHDRAERLRRGDRPDAARGLRRHDPRRPLRRGRAPLRHRARAGARRAAPSLERARLVRALRHPGPRARRLGDGAPRRPPRPGRRAARRCSPRSSSRSRRCRSRTWSRAATRPRPTGSRSWRRTIPTR